MSLEELKVALESRESIEDLIIKHKSIKGILTSFNLRPHPFYYDKVRDAAYRHNVRITSANNKNSRGILMKSGIEKQKKTNTPKVKKGAFADNERVRIAVSSATSYQDAISKLGVKNCGNNYKRLTLACSRIGIEPPQLHYQKNRKENKKKSVIRYKYNLDENALIIAAKNNKTVIEALLEQGIENPSSQLKIRASGIVKEHNFSFSRKRNAGGNYRTPKKDINLFLALGTSPISTPVKKRLIEEGLLLNRCNICKMLPIWQGDPIVLQLDHINGEPTDNRLSNLRLLCPNCHSQTDTFMNRHRTKSLKIKA